MHGVESFAWLTLGVSIAMALAIFSNRISQYTRVPAPGMFLIGAAILSAVVPGLGRLRIADVQNVVTVALVLILFDGGMQLGLRRIRPVAAAVTWIGTAGTVVTAGGVALLAHLALGLGWQTALLLGTALAPTDPAVVFSVLGRREVAGRSGDILAGESGANDPVGISLMIALLTSTGGGLARVGTGVWQFVLQMAIGGAVGLLGGLGLRRLMRLALPSEGLYPLRTLASAGVLYGVATVAHGSGFLAVFLAGVLVGDTRAPYKREVEGFHGALANLAEPVAFVVLGLTVRLRELSADDAVWPGLLLAVALIVVVRPVLVGLVQLPVRLRPGERVFVLFAGLKGAVPVLLGTFVVAAGGSDARRVYDLVFVVVAVSVVAQGALVPLVARWCRVPMRVVEPEPWALGLRFQEEPEGLRRFRVETGSPAAGTAIGDLALGEEVWISLVNRAGSVVPVRRETVLAAGDEVLALVAGNDAAAEAVFGRPAE
jgi:cell volume regulation protein A